MLRLTAGVNASYRGVVLGACFLVLGLLLPFILFFVDQDSLSFAKTIKAISVLAVASGLSGLILLLVAALHLRKLLAPSLEREASLLPPRRNAGAPDTNALQPLASRRLIAKGTIDLLPHKAQAAALKASLDDKIKEASLHLPLLFCYSPCAGFNCQKVC